MFLCGIYLTTLDALWQDYETFQYSFNTLYSYEYDKNNAMRDERYCEGENHPATVEFKRRCHTDPYNEIKTDEQQEKYDLARGNHKFKLISISICPIS